MSLAIAHAQSVNWEHSIDGVVVQGGSAASGAPLAVDVGVVSGTHLVRIWDPDPDPDTFLPNDDVGKITITGSYGASGELQLLIAGPSDVFPNFPTDALTDPGVRNLGVAASGGIEIVDPGNTGLEKQTRLAGFTVDDIRGNITVGRVQRVQSGNLNPNQPTGTIYANITTKAPDRRRTGWPTTWAIGYISAGNGIMGAITATTDGTFDASIPGTYATIDAIVVGPSTDPAVMGIRGDIRAEKGKIRSILTTGPIGVAGSPAVKIYAANGIDEVSARADEVQAPVLVRTFRADIQAALEYLGSGGYRGPSLDGPLTLIQTGGDFADGQVVATNFYRAAEVGQPPAGIFVGGAMIAPIVIEGNLDRADIVARTFAAPITIGVRADGAIVATDRVAGAIPTISIGYGTSQLASAYTGQPWQYHRGMNGHDCPPRIPVANGNNVEDMWYPGNGACLDGGAQDSVIRAKHLGVVTVKEMTQWIGYAAKPFPPRIEGTQILSLTVDDVREGIVWSGELETTLPGPCLNNDPSNDFASVAAMTLGSIGPMSDVWFKDCPLANINGSVFGELHLPRLGAPSADQVLRIADRIGALADVCTGAPTPCYFVAPRSVIVCGVTDHTPRVAEDPPTLGAIHIDQDLGPRGHVIVNAANNAGPADQLWDGDVFVREASSQIQLQRRLPQPSKAPYYEAFSGPHSYMVRDRCGDPAWIPSNLGPCPSPSLGGGAVGLAPFRIDEADCNPSHDSLWNTAQSAHPWPRRPLQANNPLLNSKFGSGEQSVTIRFYGPVRTDAPSTAHDWEEPATLWYNVNPSNVWISNLTKYARFTMKRPTDAGFSREVTVTGAVSTSFPPGYYAVQFHTAPRDPDHGQYRYPIYCDGLATNNVVPPASNLEGQVLYYFYLWPDCNPADGQIDPPDRVCDMVSQTCPADLDNGTMTGTADGGVDINDLLYFIAHYEAGDAPADLDDGSGTGTPDGGVSIDDLLYFLAQYEAGC